MARIRLAWLGLPLPFAFGCSLVVDPDRYRSGSATPDADPGVDADPGALQVSRIEPDGVFEGLGSGSGAPAIALVLHGRNFDADTALSSADPRVEIVGPTLAASDGTLLATAVRLAVDDTLAEGDQRGVELTATRRGEHADVSLAMIGLDELVLSGGDLDVGDETLRPRYARIEVSLATSLRGGSATPARLVATGAIVVGAVLDADGRSAGATAAGGCAGGGSGSPGDCGEGGGGGGTNGAGGGGGGHRAAGTAGTGDGQGAGGAAVGDPLLTALGSEGSRGNGGGGGGNGLEGSGGAGGAGGGIIVLDSEGALELSADVRARGGAGAPGPGCAITTVGSGGGGAGGALLVRAAGAAIAGAALAVDGGAGGSGGCRDGGNGAAGRIRLDLPTVAPPGGLGGAGAAARGPMWAADAVVVTADPAATLELLGGANQTYAYHVDGGPVIAVHTGASGRATVTPTLQPGRNLVCAVIDPDLTSFSAETQTCRAIAYLP